VNVQKSFIVAHVAPVRGTVVGPTLPKPIHVADVVKMLDTYLSTHAPRLLINNTVTNICSFIPQGAPMGIDTAPQTDHLQGTPEPVPATTPPSGESPEPDSARENRESLAAGQKKTPATAGSKRTRVTFEEETTGDAVTEASSATGGSVPPVRRRSPRLISPDHVRAVQELSGKIHSEDGLTAPEERVAFLAAAAITEDSHDDDDPVWEEPKLEELKSLVLEKNVWRMEYLPDGKNLISSKWVNKHKTKPTPRYKSRFTPRGFSQEQGLDYDETFAPVAKMTSLRTFLSIAASQKLYTMQCDLKTAFLNAELQEEVYCAPTPDMADLMDRLAQRIERERAGTDAKLREQRRADIKKLRQQANAIRQGAVLRMLRACYGLKQAPREWWKQIHSYLEGIGFKSNPYDPCFYTLLLPGGNYVILLLYVDDIIIGGTSQGKVQEIMNTIKKQYMVSASGPLESYLGIDIEYKREQQECLLNMEEYINKVKTRFNFAPKPSVKTPLPEKFQNALAASEEEEPLDQQFLDDFCYREKIGCLLFLMICMRPDIAFAVGLLARYSNKVSGTACAGVTHLLHYCYNTRDFTLKLGGPHTIITAYSDSDFAGEPTTRKSTGYLELFLGFGPIVWRSWLQKIIACSVGEAEYITLSETVKEVQSTRWLIKSTGIVQLITRYSSTIFGDNQASLFMSQNPVMGARTKHIGVKALHARQMIAVGVAQVEYVRSKRNIADIGTKCLPYSEHAALSLRARGHWSEVPGDHLDRPDKRILTEQSDDWA